MRLFFAITATAAFALPALAADLPSLLIVNGGDSTLDLRPLPAGPTRTHVTALPQYATGIAVWGDHAFVTGSGDDRIARVDLRAETVDLDWLSLPPLSNPWGIAIRDDHHGYVVLSAQNAVQAFDPSTAQLLGQPLSVGNWPEGCLLYGDQLYVAVTGFDTETFSYVDPAVVRIDPDQWSVAATAATHPNPQALAIHDERIFAICTGNYGAIESAVEAFQAVSLEALAHVDIGGSAGCIAIDRDGQGYLGDNSFLTTGLYTFDADLYQLLRGPNDPLGPDPTSAVATDEGRGACYSASWDLSAGTLIEWSWPELTPVGTEALGGGPAAMAIWDAPRVDLDFGALAPYPAAPGELVSLELTLVNREARDLELRIELDVFRTNGSPLGTNPGARPCFCSPPVAPCAPPWSGGFPPACRPDATI